MTALLTAELRRQIALHDMPVTGRPAIAAVSGGADSVALLLALVELAVPVVVAHLDHGLRDESAADADFVRALAERLGLICEVERRDVEGYRGERRLSLEAAARDVRHAFLRDVSERHGAGAIFLAHTADDQVETLLLRLIRGAGVAGLAGMRAKDGLLCRPMLGVWRSEVEAYLHARRQEWREDASNRDRRFLRNRVRHELLPLLKSMNPGVKRVLLREAELLGQRQHDVEAEVLRRYGLGSRQIAAALRGTPVTIRNAREVRLEAPAFDVPLAVPSEVQIDGVGVVSADSVKPGALPTLPPSPAAAREDRPALSEPEGARALSAGETFKPRGTAGTETLAEGDRARPGEGSQRRAGEPHPNPRPEGKGTGTLGEGVIDAGRVQGPLRVRSWRPGDRFMPSGMQHHKKLQDFFVDEHVPWGERGRVPLVVDGSTIVWVAGMRVDERYKVTPATKRAIRLRFEPA